MKFIAVNAGYGKSGQTVGRVFGEGGRTLAGRTRRSSVEALRSLPESGQQGRVVERTPAPGLPTGAGLPAA